MKRLSLFCLLLLVLLGVRAGEVVDPVRLRLETLGGITEIRPLKAGEFAAKYELMVEQPLDWKKPAAGTFGQRVVLMHVGYDRPTVVVTQGYGAGMALPEGYRDELSKLLDANIVFVEHRYFDRSMPEPCDWRYLTAENSAHDLHRIVELFRNLYAGKWIATGISKGGTTTMLYAAFFPGDVDAYVPYVGPLCTAREDDRFAPFMAQIGTPEARAAVEAYQVELMRRRERLLPAFGEYCRSHGYSFRLPLAEIFDYCVLEYAVSFWQWGKDPATVPAADADDECMLSHLLATSGPGYFDRNSSIASFFVQAARELGFYPYDLEPFRDVTVLRTTDDYLRRIFLPEELRDVRFSKRLCRKVSRYLRRNDPRMIFVYGGDDPWTAPGAAWSVVPGKRNMRVFVEPGGDHRTRIATLPEPMRREAEELLRGWIEN